MSQPYSYDIGTLYEKLWQDYGDQYVAECKKFGYTPDMSDFVIWAEDRNLIAEADYEQD